MAAPFSPTFVNVSPDVLHANWRQYPLEGKGLQTLCFHRFGGDFQASGSFQSGLSMQWRAVTNKTSMEYQNFVSLYHAQGFMPRQIAVQPTPAWEPRFTVIWRKIKKGEEYAAFHDLDDAGFAAKCADFINNRQWRFDEHVCYSFQGNRRHAAVFSNQSQGPGGVIYLYGQSLEAIVAMHLQAHTAGFKPASFHAYVTGAGLGVEYGALWKPSPKSTQFFLDMTPEVFMQKSQEFEQEGYTLLCLRPYLNSSKFGAIWEK